MSHNNQNEGHVVWYKSHLEYGFLHVAGYGDVYFAKADITYKGQQTGLIADQKVSCRVEPDKEKPGHYRARNVRLTSRVLERA